MKKIIFICVCILLLSCQSENEYIITKNRVGKYRMGRKLDTDFDKKIFDIKTDFKGRINTIVVSSPSYKTADLFGVGSNLDSIKATVKSFYEPNLTISKGNRVIGSLGTGIVYKGVTFIDADENGIVDFVLIYR